MKIPFQINFRPRHNTLCGHFAPGNGGRWPQAEACAADLMAMFRRRVRDERWLEEFASSLGAVFPAPAAAIEAGTGGTCPALGCSHLWSLHGPAGCAGKVFPAHSLSGEPCPCEHMIEAV